MGSAPADWRPFFAPQPDADPDQGQAQPSAAVARQRRTPAGEAHLLKQPIVVTLVVHGGDASLNIRSQVFI
jgi:hypothetical protein